MSIWGHGLYQTDSDLDTLDLIADEAAKMFSDPECLCCPLIPEYYSLRSPIDKAATVTQLNEGTFYRLLRRFKNSKNDMAVILLAAVGMELGVNFQEEDTLMVKMTVMKADIGDEKREQMIAALEGYKNDGTVWDFQKKGSVETVGSSMKEEVNENQDAAKAEGALAKLAIETEISTSQPATSTATKTTAPSTHKKTKSYDPSVDLMKKELKSALKKPGKEENRVAFRLPRSKSHPSLKVHERKASKSTASKKDVKESIFKIPAQGKAVVEKEVVPKQSDSIFRLPPPKATGRGKGK